MATQPQDLTGLSHLGNTQNKPQQTLETFPNRNAGRNYTVELSTEEFTCLCPATGQPDFAKITIRYVPGPRIVESKSLKLYYWSYRQQGMFHEACWPATVAADLPDVWPLAERLCALDADQWRLGWRLVAADRPQPPRLRHRAPADASAHLGA
ncbi:MAG: preQ(1) synthase [Verrucomicrobia bacterium]|nr:preQ(1) synthase [Verrucomicrobiota bacterium]